MESKSIDFAAIPQTAIRVITSPAEFFKEMPKSGGFIAPLVFLVIMGALSGLISGLFQAVCSIVGYQPIPGMQMSVVAVVTMPVFFAVGFAIFGFVAAAILYLIWKLMGSEESYETSYRCNAYLTTLAPLTTVLGIIPYIGGAIGIVVLLFYFVTATVQTHGIPARKAWLVFGILAAIFVVFSVSAQITARRMAGNMERAAESWQDAAEEMQKAAEKMQKQMEKELEKQKQLLPPTE